MIYNVLLQFFIFSIKCTDKKHRYEDDRTEIEQTSEIEPKKIKKTSDQPMYSYHVGNTHNTESQHQPARSEDQDSIILERIKLGFSILNSPYIIREPYSTSDQREPIFLEYAMRYFKKSILYYENLDNYLNSELDMLILCKKMWFHFPTQLLPSDNLIIADFVASACGSSSINVIPLFEQPACEFPRLRDIQYKLKREIENVSETLKFCIEEFNAILGDRTIFNMMGELIARSQLCREMLVHKHGSFLHLNMKLMNHRVLITEAKSLLSNILKEGILFEDISLHASLITLDTYIENFGRAETFFIMLLRQAFQMIKRHFPGAGFHFSLTYQKTKQKLTNIPYNFENTTYKDLVTIWKSTMSNTDSMSKINFLNSDFLNFCVYITTNRICDVFTQRLNEDFTPLINSLRIVERELTVTEPFQNR